jgi:hypothetical protein
MRRQQQPLIPLLRRRPSRTELVRHVLNKEIFSRLVDWPKDRAQTRGPLLDEGKVELLVEIELWRKTFGVNVTIPSQGQKD